MVSRAGLEPEWRLRTNKLLILNSAEYAKNAQNAEVRYTAGIEHVSVLLGHSSIRITERYYSPWIRARQEQLEAEIQRSWARDPVALLEMKGTPALSGTLKVRV